MFNLCDLQIEIIMKSFVKKDSLLKKREESLKKNIVKNTYKSLIELIKDNLNKITTT